jgi:hypothetical protein
MTGFLEQVIFSMAAVDEATKDALRAQVLSYYITGTTHRDAITMAAADEAYTAGYNAGQDKPHGNQAGLGQSDNAAMLMLQMYGVFDRIKDLERAIANAGVQAGAGLNNATGAPTAWTQHLIQLKHQVLGVAPDGEAAEAQRYDILGPFSWYQKSWLPMWVKMKHGNYGSMTNVQKVNHIIDVSGHELTLIMESIMKNYPIPQGARAADTAAMVRTTSSVTTPGALKLPERYKGKKYYKRKYKKRGGKPY